MSIRLRIVVRALCCLVVASLWLVASGCGPV